MLIISLSFLRLSLFFPICRMTIDLGKEIIAWDAFGGVAINLLYSSYNKFIAFPFEISMSIWTMDPTVLISDWLFFFFKKRPVEVLMREKVVSYFEISALMFE
jgi:hypothetical protein